MMNQPTKTVIFLLRLAIGWLLVWAGISKILNPAWSAAGFLKGAETFTGLYNWFGSSANIEWVNFLNSWGVALLGIALVLGLATRLAAYAGILLMALYYFPSLKFPYAGEHSFLVDEHVMYALVLALLVTSRAGHIWGLDSFMAKMKLPSGLGRFVKALG